MKTIVTTGNTYIDIDGLACVMTYHELLGREGVDVIAFLSGAWNNTIPHIVSEWKLTCEQKYTFSSNDRLIVMDVSEPSYIKTFLDEKQIVELYDHHFGFETYWKERVGEDAHIERVGSCATLIIEQWQKRLSSVSIPSLHANLLAWAIISNTLNFQSAVTHARDIDALAYIQPHITLPAGWVERYFQEHDAYICADPKKAMGDDTKQVNISGLDAPLIICQLELWSGGVFIKENLDTLQAMTSQVKSPYYMVTIPSISDGYNHIYCENKKVQEILANTICATFEGSVGKTPQLLLRKEILRDIQ